jgi:hypothetical protein
MKQSFTFMIGIFLTMNVFSMDSEHLTFKKLLTNNVYWTWEGIETLHKGSEGASLEELHPQGRDISIQPKGFAIFKIPKGYWLKLIEPLSRLEKTQDSPNLWYSTGNGLFIPGLIQLNSNKVVQPPQSNGDINTIQREWLMRPPTNNSLLIMLKNNNNKTIHWRLSRSKAPVIKENKTYGNYIFGNKNEANWSLESNPEKHVQLSTLKKNQHYTIDLQGPGKWALESRIFVDMFQPWQRFVNLSLKLNDTDWFDWRLHPSTNYSRTIITEQCKRLTSQPEILNITLPKGLHRLSFIAPQAMAIRLRENNENSFLLSHNQSDDNNTITTPNIDLPQAAPSYDNTLLIDYLSGNMGGEYNKSIKILDSIKIENSINLINQRYQVWRPLSIESSVLLQKNGRLIDIQQRNKYDSGHRFILDSGVIHPKEKNLFKLNTGQGIELKSPGNKLSHLMKLSFPIQNTPFELTLKSSLGKKTIWYWKPDLINKNEINIKSGDDLSALALSTVSYQKKSLATASGIITLKPEDFPITLTHNSDKELWFSPFYRDSLTFSLDEKMWLTALEKLGEEQVLALLQQQKYSKIVLKNVPDIAIKTNKLKYLVWQDWQPLRNWLLSYQNIWSHGLITPEFEKNPLRHEPLSRLIKRLTNQGDYSLLIKTLKGMAIKDPDPVRRKNALNWLFEYYQFNQDTGNLSAYHSWKFQQNPKQHLPILANWLLSQGQSKMALRLFELVNTFSHHLPYQHAKLQQAWNQDQGPLSPEVSVWHALWHQDFQKAKTLSERLNKNNTWHNFLEKMPNNKDPVEWLIWAQKSPMLSIHNNKNNNLNIKDELRTPVSLTTTKSAGTVQLYQDQRSLYFKMALTQAPSPAHYSVIGPIDMKVSIRLKHDQRDSYQSLDDWIEIKNNGNKKWFPIINSKPSSGLTLLSNPESLPGNSHSIILSLGPGLHQLSIRPMTHSAFVSAKVFSHPLLNNLVKSIQSNAILQAAPTSNQTNKISNTELDTNFFSIPRILNNMDLTILKSCHINNTKGNQDNYAHSRIIWTPPAIASQWQATHSLSNSSNTLKNFNFDNTLQIRKHNSEPIEQHLMLGLWHWSKTNIKKRSHWLAQANALAHPYKKNISIKSLIKKLNENFKFEPVEMIIASAGNRRSNSSDNSEFLAEREKQLWSGKPVQGERLYGHNKLGFITRFKTKTNIRVQLSLAHYPYYQAPTGKAIISRNGKTIKMVDLPSLPLQEKLIFSVPAGQQKVSIALMQPTQDHWLYVQAHAFLKNEWQPLLKPKYKRYDVTTKKQPLELYNNKPSWLRIDEFSNGKVKHRYQYQKDAGSLLITPKNGQKQAMIRVMRLEQKTHSTHLFPHDFKVKDETFTTNLRHIQGLSLPLLKGMIADELPTQSTDLKRIGNNTDTTYLRYQTRRDFDSTSNETEHFVEAGWRYRKKLDCLGCYWRSDVFSRKHRKTDIKILGSHQWLEGAWPQSSWSWQFKQSLFVQTTNNIPLSWLSTGTLKQIHGINETINHGHYFQLFSRYLPKNSIDFPTDNDVYSDYKNQHRWGVRLEEIITGRPWLDSRWSSHVRLVSNELNNSLKAEYVQAGIGWHQYFKPMEIGLNYHHRSYLKDTNRNNIIHKPSLGISLSYWKNIGRGEILKWKIRFTNDLNRDEYGMTLEASWGFSRGRGLKDYRPGESVFHNLHQHNIKAAQQPRTNNE